VNTNSRHGGLALSQPEKGYRSSADATALAEFAQAGSHETILDLCTGCGVIPILMWLRTPFRQAVGVDLDEELVTLAQNNVVRLNLGDKIHFLRADIRTLGRKDLRGCFQPASVGRFDVVTSNPPYWPVGRGRLNPNSRKAAARHEIFLTLFEVISAAGRFLKPGGRFYLSHLEYRKAEIRPVLNARTSPSLKPATCLDEPAESYSKPAWPGSDSRSWLGKAAQELHSPAEPRAS
jgi:tRNA1Val (adenine37-N6)-methyltransferase